MNFFKRLILFAFIFGCTAAAGYLLFDYVLMPKVVSIRDQRILLDVRSMPWNRAASLLRREGFIPMRGESKARSDLAPFTVLDQRPKPGSRVRLGRRIYLDISSAEKEVPFPNVVGKTLRGAEILIENEQMQIDTILWDYASNPKSVIFKQSVTPGIYVPKGTSVTLYASLGPLTRKVPDVVGLSQTAAIRAIEEAGLEITNIQYRFRDDLLAYTVLSQSVPGGTTLRNSRGISLVVSQLPEDKPRD